MERTKKYFVINNVTHEIIQQFDSGVQAQWWLTEVFGAERYKYEIVEQDAYIRRRLCEV